MPTPSNAKTTDGQKSLRRFQDGFSDVRLAADPRQVNIGDLLDQSFLGERTRKHLKIKALYLGDFTVSLELTPPRPLCWWFHTEC